MDASTRQPLEVSLLFLLVSASCEHQQSGAKCRQQFGPDPVCLFDMAGVCGAAGSVQRIRGEIQ